MFMLVYQSVPIKNGGFHKRILPKASSRPHRGQPRIQSPCLASVSQPWVQPMVLEFESALQHVTAKQGLVNVPFWEYWTSPYSSQYRPHIPNGWVMFNGDI